MKESTFAGRFISKLEKIDRGRVEEYLRKLWRERRFLERVFNTLQEGIIITDREGRIIFINRSAYKLLGIGQRRALLGEPMIKIVSDPTLQERISDFSLPLDGQVRTFELQVQFPHSATYLLKIIPLREEESREITSIIFIVSDVSYAKLQEQERFRQERLESLATLTAGIAHEIKNPLNALNIHAQLIKRSLGEGMPARESEDFRRVQESTEIILEEIQRLTRVVNQFITAVRPLKLQLKPCDVNQLLEEIIEMINLELKDKGIALNLLLDSDVPPIYVDEYLIRQVLLNIIKNAIEAVEHNKGEIEIRSFASGNWLYLSIKDNGRGMQEEELRRMFEPYFTTKSFGSGLGLFIVYRVIQEHKGEIQVKSEFGKGTTFVVQLPLLKRPVKLITHEKAEEDETKDFNS